MGQSEEYEDSQSEWLTGGTRGAEVIAGMAAALTESGLLTPPVPPHLADRLLASDIGWAWCTEPSIPSWSVYSVFDEASPSPFPACLDPRLGDFWLFGHRGHGANSYGMGLFARVGALVVAQQVGWGGVYMDGAASTAAVNQATTTWAQTLNSQAWGDGPPRYVVLYSSYRGYATILTCSPELRAYDDSAYGDYFPGWRTVVEAGQGHCPQLDALLKSDNKLLALAAGHLHALISERSMRLEDSDASDND